MKKISYIGILVLTFCLQSFQVKAEDVTLITSGTGISKEKAIQNALVSAVEQVYGVYVSGNTVILNDELIRDEVVQIKRGNIKEYRILNETTLPDKKYSATLQVTISPDNLLKFAQSKGAKCELAGSSFAANLKLHKLYLSNGAKAMENLYTTLGHIAPNIYDYKLNLGEPIVYDVDVYVPVEINCIPNENFKTFIELYNSTYNSVQQSLKSIPIEGDVKDPNKEFIWQYKQFIQNLPNLWAFGFLLRDNLNNSVIPQFVSPKAYLPNNGFWPASGVKNYINTYNLPPHSYIEYDIFRKDEILFKAQGIRIQKLDESPVCSINQGDTRALRALQNYTKRIGEKYERQSIIGAKSVESIKQFQNGMGVWSDGNCRLRYYTWVEHPTKIIGKDFFSIHFLLCYKGTDLEKVTDIKIYSITAEDQ